MLTVHHLNNSRSQRVLWLLEELEAPYAIEHYERNPKTKLAPDALKRVHPLGKSPVITEDGVTVAESGAIIEYILARYGNGRFSAAPGTPEAARDRYFMHYAEGSLMPLMVMHLVFHEMRRQAPALVRPLVGAIAGQLHKVYLDPTVATHVEMLELELSDRPFLTGESLTAADFQMCIPMIALQSRSKLPHPKVDAYVARITARPAFRRALDKGGPLDL